MSGLRAILVSVNYSDLLAITLPYNRKHFDEVMVVTSREDYKNVLPICGANDAYCMATNAFYERGASFNKWAALEEGLDRFGRKGWLCLMDADVLWPKTVEISIGGQNTIDISGPLMTEGCSVRIRPGQLVSPLRRMMVTFDLPLVVPDESKWKEYAIHRNINEWAGYSQIFHANDPVLGSPPWHETDWKHAGGADSFFQAKWGEKPPEWKPGQPIKSDLRVRPPFEVLHIGPAGENWYGRSTPYLDGSVEEKSAQRREQVRQIWQGRLGKHGPEKFAHEKLS